MQKVKIKVEYKGTNFSGWQKQKSSRTVQYVLEEVLSSFLGEAICLVASGRTDAGVYAKGQIAHFETNAKFDFKKLPQALEKFLPNDISVTHAEIVNNDFHARYCVKQKTYHYMCYTSKVKSALLDEFALQIKSDLDIEKIQKAMKYFVGTYDFTSFCTAKKDDEKTFEKMHNNSNLPQDKIGNVRTIFNFELEQKENILTFKITGNGFLHNMVRIIIGTVISVGQGKTDLQSLPKIFEQKNRIYAGKTVKPNGLILWDVEY